MFKAILFLIELKWLGMNRRGKFKIVSSAAPNAVFLTNFGKFMIDHSRSALVISGSKNNGEVPFGDIARLELRRSEKSAVFEEIAMGGLDLKHDKIEWCTIHLVLRDGRAVPIYAIGQYRIQVPWGQWIIEKERKLFSVIGLCRDCFMVSSAVLDQIQALFASAGQHYPANKHGEAKQPQTESIRRMTTPDPL